MAEEAKEATTTVETTETTTDGPSSPPSEDLAGLKSALEKERAAAREGRQAAKDAAALRQQLKQFEDRDKSEADKLTERATAAEQRATAQEARAMRLEVAFEKGLTPAQAKRLVGESREDLEADADEILRDFPAKPGRPVGDIAQGTRQPTATPLDPRAADLQQIEEDLRLSRRK